MVNTEHAVEIMDEEWMNLILEAKRLGITKETVRTFLNQSDFKEQLIEKC
ncbi:MULTISPECIES: anti-repressor SinI family protein [Bacillus]|uniref:Anti-repressor SinI family protein n=1 Tax=Bacillus xiapuensis TaxID=2014075 RepID=A0ABU6N6H9_9BACI|nr:MULTISPECIES: anti-repressor SinI family protein [Bacillus]MED3561819.1 anti-repressor SinI family protein [Bacillus xiapuensis]